LTKISITTQTGEPLLDEEITGFDAISRKVADWVRVLPDFPIYIDGNLLPVKVRQEVWNAMLHAETARTASLVPMTTAKEFEHLYNLLGQTISDFRRAQIQILEQVKALASGHSNYYKSLSAILLGSRPPENEDTAPRSTLHYQSFRDIESLDRRLSSMELTAEFQRVGARGDKAARTRGAGAGRGGALNDWQQALAAIVADTSGE
jgi:hypothetical protein